MGSNLTMRRAAAVAILVIGAGAATPALAGRCGHSYAVDAPTTLSKVARACNVSFRALVEANRGVDPAYVRPGEHLAVPGETEYAGDISVPVIEPVADPDVRHPYITSSPGASYRDYYDDRASDVRRVNVNAYDGPSTYFDTRNAPVHARHDGGLSYQKFSAARIRTAGLMMQPSSTPARSPLTPSLGIRSISAAPTPLMECSVLRRKPSGKIQQVTELTVAPVDQEIPAHCASFVSAKPMRSIVTRGVLIAAPAAEPTNLTVFKGYVTDVDAECVTLRADDGMTWRMNAPLEASDMLGKEATVWAEFTRNPTCGGLVLDHAVYAERL